MHFRKVFDVLYHVGVQNVIEDLFLDNIDALLDEFWLSDMFHQYIQHHMNKGRCRHL